MDTHGSHRPAVTVADIVTYQTHSSKAIHQSNPPVCSGAARNTHHGNGIAGRGDARSIGGTDGFARN
jgi:hypothetical protein